MKDVVNIVEQKEKTNTCLNLHIKYLDAFNLHNMTESLQLLNECFDLFYSEHITNDTYLSPVITNIKKGSLIIEVIVPLVCSCLPILYDIIKNKFLNNTKFSVTIKEKQFKYKWEYKDNLKVTKIVFNEFVINQTSLSINDLAKKIKLSKPYGQISIKDKIKNTKALLEEYKIFNTLNCRELKKYSKMHKRAFLDVCKKFNIDI